MTKRWLVRRSERNTERPFRRVLGKPPVIFSDGWYCHLLPVPTNLLVQTTCRTQNSYVLFGEAHLLELLSCMGIRHHSPLRFLEVTEEKVVGHR